MSLYLRDVFTVEMNYFLLPSHFFGILANDDEQFFGLLFPKINWTQPRR